MNAATLALTSRKQTGSTAARALRREGMVPATLFGHGGDPQSLAAEEKPLNELLRSGAGRHLVKITVDGKPADTALVRSVERDGVSRALIHIDLQRVGSKESIKATVGIVLEGTALGVKEQGGQLDFVTHAIDISGPADSLPDSLVVDIGGLRLKEHVSAADVKLPPNFVLVTLPETPIVTIDIPQVEDLDATAAENAGVAQAASEGAETAAPAS